MHALPERKVTVWTISLNVVSAGTEHAYKVLPVGMPLPLRRIMDVGSSVSSACTVGTKPSSTRPFNAISVSAGEPSENAARSSRLAPVGIKPVGIVSAALPVT